MKRLLAVGMVLSLARPATAENSAAAIAYNCRNCHSPDAEALALTSLADLSAAQIKQKLLGFKYDRSPATLMPRLAKGYSDVELSAVAAYLGKP